MRGEYATGTDLGHIVGRLAWREVLGSDLPAVQQLKGQERRVTFVQMIGMQIEAERSQNANAADAKNDLLFQPVRHVAAIEVMRQRAVLLAILIELGIKEQDRDLLTVGAGMNVEPWSNPHWLLLDIDGDHRIERRAPTCGFP